MNMKPNDNRPMHEIRLGRIKAAIWQNETEQGIRYSVSIARLYRKEDRWQSTSSFGRDDLPLVAKVADLAHSWLYEQRSEHRGSSSENRENDPSTANLGEDSQVVA